MTTKFKHELRDILSTLIQPGDPILPNLEAMHSAVGYPYAHDDITTVNGIEVIISYLEMIEAEGKRSQVNAKEPIK